MESKTESDSVDNTISLLENLGTEADYDEVLSAYKEAISSKEMRQGVNPELMSGSTTLNDVFYALEDLDGNGTKELLIVKGCGQENTTTIQWGTWSRQLYDVRTLDDTGSIVALSTGIGYRVNWVPLVNGQFLERG